MIRDIADLKYTFREARMYTILKHLFALYRCISPLIYAIIECFSFEIQYPIPIISMVYQLHADEIHFYLIADGT